MGFDRSKFKATKMDVVKQQEQELEDKTGFGDSGTRPKFNNLQEGRNKVRIYPSHPNSPSESFVQPKMVHWLEVEVESEKDGKKKKELKRKPVFSGKVHSETGMCPVGEYIEMVHTIAKDEYQDKDERKKFTSKLGGMKGIYGNKTYIVYADVNGKFGRFELKKSVKEAMNDIAAGQEDPDEVINTDPFTDPDNGRMVFIIYNSQSDLAKKDRKIDDFYKVAIDLKGPTPLSDEQLEKFSECDTLDEMYVNVYTRKDFDMAVEGLKRFDEESEYGIFAIDEFLDKLEEIYNALPEPPEEDEGDDSEEEEKPKKSTRSSRKKKEEVEEEDDSEDDEEVEDDEEEIEEDELEEDDSEEESEEDEESDLPFDKPYSKMSMDELKGVIRRNKLPIRVTPRIKLPELREWVEEEMDIINKEREEKEKEDSKESSGKKTGGKRRGKKNLDAIKEELED